MKYIGRDVDIDPYDKHYWIQRFFKHLKDAHILTNGREISVRRLNRELALFCTRAKIDRSHLMHTMLNDKYIEASAEATFDIQWNKVR